MTSERDQPYQQREAVEANGQAIGQHQAESDPPQSILSVCLAMNSQSLNLFLVARRMSSDSLVSFTARASTSAPTSEAAVASAFSSRCRGFSPDSIRPLRSAITPRTPAVKRSLTPLLWRGISQHRAANGQPLPGSSRCSAERYSAT